MEWIFVMVGVVIGIVISTAILKYTYFICNKKDSGVGYFKIDEMPDSEETGDYTLRFEIPKYQELNEKTWLVLKNKK